MALCQHVFSHLPDLRRPVAEFACVLRDGGTLVVSTHNPVHDYVVVREGEYPTGGGEDGLDATVEPDAAVPDYTATERYDVTWNPEAVANRATYYRRPFAALVSPLLRAGFALTGVAEPSPDEAFEREHPELAARLRGHPPESLCLRATR